MTIGRRIREARKNKGLSQAELAQNVGYSSRSSINKIESDNRDIPRDMLVKIAVALDVTPAYLAGWEDVPMERTTPQIEEKEIDYTTLSPDIRPIRTQKIPMLGSIACGEPIFDEEFDTFIEASADLKCDFCLTCRGDSMINANIKDGDVVFIRKADIVDNGRIAAVMIDGEVTLKRVYYYPEKNKLVLNPENPVYEPFIYTNEELNDIRILGQAVAYISLVK